MEQMLARMMVIALLQQIMLMSYATAPMNGLDQIAIEVLRSKCQQISGFTSFNEHFDDDINFLTVTFFCKIISSTWLASTTNSYSDKNVQQSWVSTMT